MPQSDVPLRAEDITVGEILKQAGYKTGIFGKWGVGGNDTSGRPNRKGFDVFFGYLTNIEAHSYFVRSLWRNSEAVSYEAPTYSHDRIVEAAFHFIRGHKDEPFFLYLPLTIPHPSIEVPEDSLAPFDGQFPEPSPAPLRVASYTPQPKPLAAFAGMIPHGSRCRPTARAPQGAQPR